MKYSIGTDRGAVLILPVQQDKDGLRILAESYAGMESELAEQAKRLGFSGENEQCQLFLILNREVLAVGCNGSLESESLRRTFSVAYETLKKHQITTVDLAFPTDSETIISAVIEGMELSSYTFSKYLSKKKEPFQLQANLLISRKHQKLVQRLKSIHAHVFLSRDITNENSYVMTPKALGELIRKRARKHKLKTRVLNEKDIAKQGLNLLQAVGKGSSHPPRLILVEYQGNPKSKEKTALVGKGITFDTGGYNLKPTNFIEDMRLDKGGAAIMVGAFFAAVELQLQQNLILAIPAAENSISGSAYNPGDIYRSFDGTSVEIGNTDAEGRLVLADALSYVQKHYKPSAIIDAATLTGACPISLGPNLIALIGNTPEMTKSLFEAGEVTFDRAWELPLYGEHRELLKTTYADIKSTGGRYGGTITAAAFLEHFINPAVKWSHMDVAGAAKSDKKKYYIPEFGTGRGVRLLVEYLRNL